MPADCRAARRRILDAIGPEALAELHRPRPLLDALAVAVAGGLFLGLAVFLAGWPLGPAWLAALVAQGFVIQVMAYVTHDLSVHRRAFGPRLAYAVGVLFELPILARRTWYARYHLDHHARLGTPRDPEAYKQDLDTRTKRWLALTLPGAFLGFARLLRSRDAATPALPMAPLDPPGPRDARRLRREGLLLGAAAAGLGALAWLDWRPVVLGYLLPLAVVTPVASMLRLVLEHAEADPDNAFACATFYRTGPVSRPAFFWDAGDCHVVHHLFPGIPFHRMGRALALMNPILEAEGARARSLGDLLHGYFVRAEPHGARWGRGEAGGPAQPAISR